MCRFDETTQKSRLNTPFLLGFRGVSLVTLRFENLFWKNSLLSRSK
jgi:hypothetical protein